MASAGFITSEQPRTVVPATTSPRDSRRSSAEQSKESGSLKHIAQKIATAAKRHHQEVNRAFDAVYGTRYYH
jgi:hypothetical protein